MSDAPDPIPDAGHYPAEVANNQKLHEVPDQDAKRAALEDRGPNHALGAGYSERGRSSSSVGSSALLSGTIGWSEPISCI